MLTHLHRYSDSNRVSRVASLEQRLDALTTTLHAKEKKISQLTAQAAPTPESDHSIASRPKTPSPPFGLTWRQAASSLQNYREHFFLHFPFIVIPEHITAQLLFETKPTLFRSIMLVAAPLPIPRLTKMKRNVIAYISQHILVENERNLDLLEGLIVLLAWYVHHYQYFTSLTQLGATWKSCTTLRSQILPTWQLDTLTISASPKSHPLSCSKSAWMTSLKMCAATKRKSSPSTCIPWKNNEPS